MRIIKVITAGVIVLSFIQPTYAFKSAGALGAKIGSQGIGVEGRTPISRNIFARLGVNYFTYNNNAKNNKIDFTLLSIPLMLDIHPFDNLGFKLSAGIAYNGNKFKASATKVGDEAGLVTGRLKWDNEFAGIATIGYDGSFHTGSQWSFNCEAGVMYMGDPKISISTTFNDGGKSQRDMEEKLNRHKKHLRLYPVLSLGFKYAFSAI